MKEKINKNKDIWLQEIATQKEIQSTLKAIIHSTDDAISVVDMKMACILLLILLIPGLPG
jgi:hypothetical protein